MPFSISNKLWHCWWVFFLLHPKTTEKYKSVTNYRKHSQRHNRPKGWVPSPKWGRGWSKLWPANFLEHLPIFAGNSRSTGISQLRAGKTRSKRPRSHCLSTGHLLPYMWASFHPLDPSRYLSSFSSWMKLCAIIIVQCKTLICFFYQGMWQLHWQNCNVDITKIMCKV